MINAERYRPQAPLPPELDAMITLISNEPTLEQIWRTMDFVWQSLGCENRDPGSIQKFYAHPVWLLNGLFIEQHELSLENRRQMVEYIIPLQPARIADYGGGFGTLARMLCEQLPQAAIEIVEPFHSALARQLAEPFKNLAYVPRLTGAYDLIIATDVLEHVSDPLQLVELLANHLSPDGQLLLANCFYPVILCHLPETFHFRYSFTLLLDRMNLKKIGTVSYATVYASTGNNNITRAVRMLEVCSRLCFPILVLLHKVWGKLMA